MQSLYPQSSNAAENHMIENHMIDRIGKAIAINWQVAHESPTSDDWRYRWSKMEHELEGMSLALIYLIDLDEPEYQEACGSLRMLRNVAWALSSSEYFDAAS